MNCPPITPISGECEPRLAGLGSTIYIGRASDGMNIPMENMIAVNLPPESVAVELEEPSDSTAWNPAEGRTFSFTVETTLEDREKQRKLFDRLFGTAGLTRKRIVRERKTYNWFRRRLKNPIRKHIPLYKESNHRGIIDSLSHAIIVANEKEELKRNGNFTYRDVQED